jgi:mannosyl-oligosaccharide alpha-1,2-mannosidase
MIILIILHFPAPSPIIVPFIPGSVNWSKFEQFHPVDSIKPPPTNRPQRLPSVQADQSLFKHTELTEQRRAAVRDEFLRSYNAYKEFAWMMDELAPLSGTGKTTFGGWAATLVDSFDTLWIMGLQEEFKEATIAISAMDFSVTKERGINVFETTIRHLGGLLGAYDLSGEPTLLQKAREVGEMLYVAFDTPNRLPGFWLNFEDARNGRQVAGTNDPSASPASLTLEMTRLSQLTGDPKFYDAADRVIRFLDTVQNDTQLPGMWPLTVNFQDETAEGDTFSIGALADSLYEYLPKMHALLGGVDPLYERLYLTSADVVINNLLYRPMVPDNADILIAGDVWVNSQGLSLNPDSQHLSCFAGGMFGLGGRLTGNDSHVEVGKKLARGCGWVYNAFPTGIMPEIYGMIPCESVESCEWDESRWKPDDKSIPKGLSHARDPRYLLRPEAIESIFIMYRITGDTEWQDLAWKMFQSIVKVSRTELANAALNDVSNPDSPNSDSMEVSRVSVLHSLFSKRS